MWKAADSYFEHSDELLDPQALRKAGERGHVRRRRNSTDTGWLYELSSVCAYYTQYAESFRSALGTDRDN